MCTHEKLKTRNQLPTTPVNEGVYYAKTLEQETLRPANQNKAQPRAVHKWNVEFGSAI